MAESITKVDFGICDVWMGPHPELPECKNWKRVPPNPEPEAHLKEATAFGSLSTVVPEATPPQRGLVDIPSDYFGHPRFYEIVDELKKLHSEKNRQYASKGDPLGNFRRTGNMIAKMLKPGVNPTLASCLSLVSKQIDAIYDIVGEGKTNTVESLRDKLRDVAVYSVIAMVIVEEINGPHSD